MAQRLRDEHGNPIELTDEHGNPVRLTDEHGRPMHLSGVATTHAPSTDVGTGAGYTGLASGHESGLGGHDKIHGDTGATAGGIYGGVLTSTTKLGVGTGTGTSLLHPEQPHQMGGLGGDSRTTQAPGAHVGTGIGTGLLRPEQSHQMGSLGGDSRTTQAPGAHVGTGTGYSGLAPVHESGQHGQVLGGTAATAAGGMAGHGVGTGQHHERLGEQLRHTGGERGELRRSSSSSSSSSEDDGQGGRRKKKGLTTKIKEKLTGKHEDEHAQGTAATWATTTTTTTGQAGRLHPEHEKKSMMEKIKEKLPGHHTTHP